MIKLSKHKIVVGVWVVRFILPITILITGCRKLVEVPAPVTTLSSEDVYSNDETAAAVLTAIYIEISGNSVQDPSSISSISFIGGLSADELTLFGGANNANSTLVQYYLNNINAGAVNVLGNYMWNDFYSKIYIVNLAIEKLDKQTTLTPSVSRQLIGEAKFLRAFLYFYLVNLYGDVPLTITSDYRYNSSIGRSSTNAVYNLIISDLKDAKGMLSDGYVASDAKTSTTERVRPNKWAASCLLARTYLYMSQWANAINEASIVIANRSLYKLVALNSIFLKNSDEAIWELQPVNQGWNTEDARTYILPSFGPTSSNNFSGHPAYLNSLLLNSFEVGDKRRYFWVDSVLVPSANGVLIYYYPYKYKNASPNSSITEYSIVFRLAEQYLLRAEAEAEMGNFIAADSDLNAIRSRAGLSNINLNSKGDLIAAILHERQVELFTEWGHRWIDAKRTGTIDVVMQKADSAKNAIWNSNRQWFPIPFYDINLDPNINQNAGY